MGQHLALNKDEEKKFYEAHKRNWNSPNRSRLSEILIAPQMPQPAVEVDGKPVPPSEADTEAALAAAKTKADDVLDQIHKGAKFADLAKKYGNGPSSKKAAT